MKPPLMTGPIALYANFPIAPQNFQPSQFFISAITLGLTTIVTTTVNHNYVIGQLCRTLIPNGYGTRELNESQAYVISIPNANQVELDIDSSKFNPFNNAGFPTQPQIVAVGDVNTGVVNVNGNLSTLTFIPGSFENISPA